MARNTWLDLVAHQVVDGPTVTNVTTESALVSGLPIPAEAMDKRTLLLLYVAGKYSTAAATPGTLTVRVRWGGVGGAILCGSGALTLGTSITNVTFKLTAEISCRDSGTAGAFVTTGEVNLSGVSVMPPANLTTVAVDTTIVNNLAVTAQFSVANAANSIQALQAFVLSGDR